MLESLSEYSICRMSAFFWFEFCCFSAQLEVAQSDICGLFISHTVFNCLCCHLFRLLFFFAIYYFRDSSNNILIIFLYCQEKAVAELLIIRRRDRTLCSTGTLIIRFINRCVNQTWNSGIKFLLIFWYLCLRPSHNLKG